MSEREPATLGAGLQRSKSALEERRLEIAAGIVCLLWLLICVIFWWPSGAGLPGFAGLLWTVGLVLPVGLLWLAVWMFRQMQVLQAESNHLRRVLAEIARPQASTSTHAVPNPDVSAKLDAVLLAVEELRGPAAVAMEHQHESQPALAPEPEPEPEEEPQPSLSLGTPAEALNAPVTIPEFIRALNFPETEEDAEGFAMLRKALRDRNTKKLVRSSQDALTLLSQDGIYMDDLSPDRARPEIWRAFARGERGGAIAGLGGVHDRSSLALAAGRMKQDPVFRDAVHHFLRAYDQIFMEFERHASDEDIIRLADTRTSRAFMLLGRVTGTFD